MLAERRVGDHLTQEVEVRRHQRHDATAYEHRHVLLVVQSHFLRKPEGSFQSSSPGLSTAALHAVTSTQSTFPGTHWEVSQIIPFTDPKPTRSFFKNPKANPNSFTPLVKTRSNPTAVSEGHRRHLQGDGEPDQVDDHFLVGQLDGQDGQGGEEQLKVFVDVVFLFAAKVDVTVELLTMLQGRGTKDRRGETCKEGSSAVHRRASDINIQVQRRLNSC